MPVDLHLHSTASDGTETPAEVVSLAAAAGLSAVALTDHDTLAGIPEAVAAAAGIGVRVIPGTELSIDWPAGTLHLLVYFLEPGAGPLQDRLEGLRMGRHDRNRSMVEALRDMGIDISYDEVVAEAGDGEGAVGRPHIGAVLVAKGIVGDMREAFEQYIGNGSPAYRPRARLSLAEAVALSRASDAVPVVAHPHTTAAGAAEYGEALRHFAESGVAGVECWYAEYTPELRGHLATLTESYGMVPTGGSDFHGRYKPDLHIGVGRGDLVVDDLVLARLEAVRTG